MAKEPVKPKAGLPASGFGAELRRIREEKALTQKQLAEAAGVHPNTIAKMERAEIEPSWPMVLALAKALGVDCTAFNVTSSEPGAEEPEQPAAEKKPKGGKPKK